MDDKTVKTVNALAHPGASILLRLVDGDATEAALVRAVEGATQGTTHRRLVQLELLGVLERSGRGWRAPGRLWSVAHPIEVVALLEAALTLSDAIEGRDREQRDAAREVLKRSRVTQRRLRAVGSDE